MGILAAENMPNNTMEELVEQHIELAYLASSLAVTVAYACETRSANYEDITSHLATPQIVFDGVPDENWIEKRFEADDESTLSDLLVDVACIGLSSAEEDNVSEDNIDEATTLVHAMIANCHAVQDVLEPEQLYYMLFGIAMAQLGMGGDGLLAQEGDDEAGEAEDADAADAADEDDQFQPE
jgi:hypothetical protein